MRDAPEMPTLATEVSSASMTRDAPAPAPAAPLAVGAVLNGRYRIEALLGRGGMGLVYAVEDMLHPGRRLALKTVQHARLAAHVSLFKSELKTMAALRHPNVAAVHDFEPLPGAAAEHLFTMELAEGRDLLRATEGAPVDVIVGLLVQVCRALSYLHSRRVIHFDLKPANIVVDETGRVRVLDFGLAGAAQGRAPAGTPAYMAPETARGDGLIDHRADLYSLGIIAYQLVGRRLPFEAASVLELMRRHATEDVTFDDDAPAPPWLRQVISRLAGSSRALSLRQRGHRGPQPRRRDVLSARDGGDARELHPVEPLRRSRGGAGPPPRLHPGTHRGHRDRRAPPAPRRRDPAMPCSAGGTPVKSVTQAGIVDEGRTVLR